MERRRQPDEEMGWRTAENEEKEMLCSVYRWFEVKSLGGGKIYAS